MRLVISKIIVEKLQSIDLKYPEVTDQHKTDMLMGREILMNEGNHKK